MLISIVSPVYNCTDCLHEIVRRTRDAFSGQPMDWEIVFVDDRGPGDPWSVIEELAREDGRVRGVRLMRNHGQHLAIWAGFAHARGDWVGVVDCDLQDDPSVLPLLHARAQEGGADAVIVDRGIWHDSRWRRVASSGFYNIIGRLSGFRIDSNVGNFGLYSRRMVDTLLSFRDREVFLPAMAVMTGLRRESYTVPRSARAAGRSSYDLKRLLRFAAALIVRFSDRPLKLSILVGLAISGLSAVFGLMLLVAWLLGRIDQQGWTSLILSIWFVGGLILSALGVQGFYIGRIFMEVQARPRIRVEQVAGDLASIPHERI